MLMMWSDDKVLVRHGDKLVKEDNFWLMIMMMLTIIIGTIGYLLLEREAISCEDEFSENTYRRNTESDCIHSIGTSCDPEVYAGARFITGSL